MKKQIYFSLFLLFIIGETFAQTINIETKNSILIFKIGNNKRLYQSYLGNKIPENKYPDQRSEAYAAAGMNFEFEPAIRVIHADGNPSLELKYLNHQTSSNSDGSTLTTILLKDEVYQTEVDIFYNTYPNQDVVKTWTSITNKENKNIILTHYASSMLHLNATKYWLMQFHGDWAKEMQLQEQQLTSG